MKNRRNKKIVTMVMAMIFALSITLTGTKDARAEPLLATFAIAAAIAYAGVIALGIWHKQNTRPEAREDNTNVLDEQGSGDKKDQEDKSIDRSDSDPYAGD